LYGLLLVVMARPKGTKYIETPEKMWELFEAYRKEVKDNPRHISEYVGKDGEHVHKPLERPLTFEGFECFVMDNTKITYPDLSEYFDGKNESYADYFHICSRIKREIRTDQIEGGMVGQYNASITQRLNGLADKKELNADVKVTPIQGMEIK
jgi:hypothetical protein